MVFGNHEFYKQSILIPPHSFPNIQKIETSFENFTLLDNEMVEYEGMYIIGSTLWSKVDINEKEKKEKKINDYRQIEHFTLEKGNELFEKNYLFLEKSISLCEKDGKECIIITHHLPTIKMIHPQYKVHPLTEFFASDCEVLIRPPVKLWVCGHSHKRMESNVNNVSLICNPKGYPSEWSDYSKTCVYIYDV